jgi:hypothetical protein
MRDNTMVENLKEALDDSDDEEDYSEEENEETLTKEEAMEMIHRKRSNRLH